jgi:hypothetical protein
MLLARPMDYESSDYDGLWKHQVLYHKHNLIKSPSSMVHVGRSRTLGHHHPLTLHHAATEAGLETMSSEVIVGGSVTW